MSVKLLTEHHLEFLLFKGGCRGSSESTYVKMPHYWKSHALAHNLMLLETCNCTNRANTHVFDDVLLSFFLLSMQDKMIAMEQLETFRCHLDMLWYKKRGW